MNRHVTPTAAGLFERLQKCKHTGVLWLKRVTCFVLTPAVWLGCSSGADVPDSDDKQIVLNEVPDDLPDSPTYPLIPSHSSLKPRLTFPDEAPDFVRFDVCPNDPLKAGPGVCGCGRADEDEDEDGVADCLELCGDENIDPHEGCDDGNAINGDGCSTRCREPGGLEWLVMFEDWLGVRRHCIAPDRNGNVFVWVDADSTYLESEIDLWFAYLDASGEPLGQWWEEQGTPRGLDISARQGCRTRSSGTIDLFAYDDSDNPWMSTFVYDGDGSFAAPVSPENWDGSSSYGGERNRSGEVFVFGAATVGEVDKYDSQGQRLWSSSFLEDNEIVVHSLIADSQGGVLVAGHVASPDASVLVKLDANGEQVWRKIYATAKIVVRELTNSELLVFVRDSNKAQFVVTLNGEGTFVRSEVWTSGMPGNDELVVLSGGTLAAWSSGSETVEVTKYNARGELTYDWELQVASVIEVAAESVVGERPSFPISGAVIGPDGALYVHGVWDNFSRKPKDQVERTVPNLPGYGSLWLAKVEL